MLISQSHMFFSLHPSVFNYQVCSFKGWPRRWRPWRSKPAGTLESDQTFSSCRQSGNGLSLPASQSSSDTCSHEVRAVCDDYTCCTCTAEYNSSAAILEWSIKFTLALWSAVLAALGVVASWSVASQSAMVDLNPKLGALLMAMGNRVSFFVQSLLITGRCSSWLCIDDGCWFQLFSG